MAKIQKGEVRNPNGRRGKQTRDGWTNVQRGLGMSRDAKMQTYFQGGSLKSNLQSQLESIYSQSWIGRKVVDIPVDDAMRNGVIIEHEDTAVVEAVEARMKELKIHKKIDSLVKWSRVYGSAVMVLVSGEDSIANPPQIGIGDISNFAVLDKFDVSAVGVDNNPLSANYLQPTKYIIGASGEVHNDRILKIDGAETTNWTKRNLNGWGLSIYEAGFNAMQTSETSTEMINNLIYQSNVDFYKIKGLNEALSTGQDELVIKRIEIAQGMKSVLNGVALDGEDGYENVAKSFGGLNEINMGMLSIVAGAFDIPLTRLLGKSADGMNATGEGDLANYYDMVKSLQESDIRDAYEWALKFISLDLFGEDKKLSVIFPPLWQMSDAQRADLELKRAQADQIHISNGTVTPLDCRRRLAEDETYPSVTLESVAKEQEESEELDLDNIEIYGNEA